MELEELKCPNCKEFFDVSNGKIPRLLTSCGHSLCEVCILNKLTIKDENGYSVVNCSEDDEIYNQIKTVDQFPKNMTLIKLLNKSLESRKTIKEKLEHLSTLLTNDPKEEKEFTPAKVSRTEDKQSEIIELQCSENKNIGLTTTPPSKNITNVEENSKEENINPSSNSQQSNVLDLSENKKNLSVNYSINQNLDNKLEAVNQQCALTSANRSSLRIGLLLKQDSRLNFHHDKSIRQSMQNINQYPPNDPTIFCQVHANRALELICLDDKEKICTNCALFGNHKKHNIISEEDFIKEIEVKAEILIELFELIDNYSLSFTDKSYSDKFTNLQEKSNEKLEALIRQVKDFTQELISNIKKSEQDIINQIHKKFEPINNKIKVTKELPNEIVFKADEWKSQVQQKLDKLNEINDSSNATGFTKDEVAKLIDVNITNQETISNAEEISDELEKMKSIPTDVLEEMINNIELEFNYEMALKLNNLILIINPNESEKDKELLKLDEQEKKRLIERAPSVEVVSPNQANQIRIIQNVPSNTNFSMQSIVTSTSGETLGNYFAATENESIQAGCNSGNYSFLNLSEDSGIIRLNSLNANKMNELNKGKENPQIKPRYSNAGLTNNSLNAIANANANPNINPNSSSKYNQNKTIKTGLYNSNANTSNFNSTNASVNNIVTVNPSINTIKMSSVNKTEKSDKLEKLLLSPGRDEEYSKSPTPDRDKIVFIKTQFKNEIANFTGYGKNNFNN
jgi:hypothetical protein